MHSSYSVNLGAYFPSRNFDASAGTSPGVRPPLIDWEKSLGATDKVDIFNIEVSWRYSENWGLTLQRFESARSTQQTLESTIEWDELTYEAGINITAKSETSITRLFFSRDYRDGERHSLRLGAGIHYIETSAEINGIATLEDASKEFRRSVVSASLPVPNIGAWYRFSPTERWMLSARADWFSANVGDYSGRIWNIAAGANFKLTDHVGLGLSFQFFELDGAVQDTRWRGYLQTRFDGPVINLTGYW